MKINLYTTYYNDLKPERQAEYIYCIEKNLDNHLINKIIFLMEEDVKIPFNNEKIITYIVSGRPSYQEYIKAINQFTGPSDYNMISSTDIYFDQSLSLLGLINCDEKTVICLTRWDIINDRECRFFNRYYTNDTWIFRGAVEEFEAKYYYGQPGCDNGFNYDLFKRGFTLINPCFSIYSWHYHMTQIRTYTENPSNYLPVPKPYLYLLPNFLKDHSQTACYHEKKKLYRQIRYELYKRVLYNDLGEDVYLQKFESVNRWKSFFYCIFYFNYRRENLMEKFFLISSLQKEFNSKDA